MIFAPESIELIKAGKKVMTRRPVKEGDRLHAGRGSVVNLTLAAAIGWRDKWKVGRTYAMCPGRGKPSVGRILLTGIRCERVCDITNEDAKKEGLRRGNSRKSDVPLRGTWYYGEWGQTDLEFAPYGNARDAYLELWKSLYPKSDCTELCWVLEFEMVTP